MERLTHLRLHQRPKWTKNDRTHRTAPRLTGYPKPKILFLLRLLARRSPGTAKRPLIWDKNCCADEILIPKTRMPPIQKSEQEAYAVSSFPPNTATRRYSRNLELSIVDSKHYPLPTPFNESMNASCVCSISFVFFSTFISCGPLEMGLPFRTWSLFKASSSRPFSFDYRGVERDFFSCSAQGVRSEV